MTKKLKPYEKKLYLAGMWRGILICAAVVAAAYAVPKGVKALDNHIQDAQYAEEHSQIKKLRQILDERDEAAQEIILHGGTPDREEDPYEETVKKALRYREKRHFQEKKNAPCKYCEHDPL